MTEKLYKFSLELEVLQAESVILEIRNKPRADELLPQVRTFTEDIHRTMDWIEEEAIPSENYEGIMDEIIRLHAITDQLRAEFNEKA